MELKACNEGFILSSQGVTVSIASEHQKAEKPQRDNIIRQLTKLGGTPYECSEVILPADFNYFIPSSQLSALRHDLVDAMITHQLATHEAGIAQTATICQKTTANTVPVPAYALPYYYNISNNSSHQFYAERQLKHLSPAFELEAQHSSVLMQCRHCLRFALGYCVRNGGKQPTWKEPLFLQLANGKRFRLQFDCRQCQMNVWNEE
jgi:putative protease